MSSSMHLQSVVAHSSLTSLCETVNETPMYEQRQRRHAPLSRLKTVLAQIRVPVAFLNQARYSCAAKKLIMSG